MDDDEGLDCPICLDTYNEASRTPKMMPCLHSVCATCIIDLALPGIPRSRGNIYGELTGDPVIPRGKKFCCPLCREEIFTDRIQTNRYILAHLRDLKKLSTNTKKPLARTTKVSPKTPKPSSPPLKAPDQPPPPPPPPPISTLPTLKPKEKSKNTSKGFLGLPVLKETKPILANGISFQKSKKSETSTANPKSFSKRPKPPKLPPPPPPVQGRTTPPVQKKTTRQAPRTNTPHIPIPNKPPAPLPKPTSFSRTPNQNPHPVVRRWYPNPPQAPVLSHPNPPQAAVLSHLNPPQAPVLSHPNPPQAPVLPHPNHPQAPVLPHLNQPQQFPQHPSLHPPPSYNPYYAGSSPTFVQAGDSFRPNEPTHYPISQLLQSPSSQTTPPTPPSADYPPIAPKPPPATTLHQKNPNQNLSGFGPRRIAILYPSIPECLMTPSSPPSAPPAPPNPETMWCRTCEEPGKITCGGHDLIPLLRAQEVDWIVELQQKIEKKMEQEHTDEEIARALAQNYLVVPTSSSTQETPAIINRSEENEAEKKPIDFDLSNNTYKELIDVVNTSCDPDFLMACVKELDRRHIEYRRTIRRKNKKREPV